MLDVLHRSSSMRRILLLAALVLSFAAVTDAAPRKRVVVRRGPRGRVVVNVHRRPGFWRGVRVGAAVMALPVGYRHFVIRGNPYYYYEGVYYRPAASGYVVAAPPVGALVAAVPAGCVPVKHGNVVYQYCAGTYYSPASGGFIVVETPIGVTVDELPVGCEEIAEVDGVEHYSCSGVFYRPVVQGGGTVYITVKP